MREWRERWLEGLARDHVAGRARTGIGSEILAWDSFRDRLAGGLNVVLDHPHPRAAPSTPSFILLSAGECFAALQPRSDRRAITPEKC